VAYHGPGTCQPFEERLECPISAKLIDDSLLTPGWVIVSHQVNQFSEVFRQRRTAPLARFPSPQRFECSAVPLDECLWLKITSALRHSKNFASATMARRSEAVVRRDFACRFWNKASCFRRNRFSAIRATRVKMNNRMNVRNPVFHRNLGASLPSGPNYCGPQGGFDSGFRFMEDVELGYRLSCAGRRHGNVRPPRAPPSAVASSTEAS
jgi:hypothetical protein